MHSYCKQTLRHGKLQHALAGLLLGSSRTRLASRRPWRYLRVDRSSPGLARPSQIGGLECLGQPSRKSSDLFHISAGFECMKGNELTSPQVHLINRVGAPHVLRPLIRRQPPHWAPCTHVCPHFPPLSPRNSAALSPRRFHCTFTASKNSAMTSFKMLYLGCCWALHGLGWLHIFIGDTSKSNAAALVVSGYRTLVDPEIWVTITKIVRFIHISARKRRSSYSEPSIHRFGAPHELRPTEQCQ